MDAIGSGCFSRMEAINDAWLAPANAFLSGHHLVEDRAEREDVGPRVGLLSFELLGRHVLQGSEDRALRP